MALIKNQHEDGTMVRPWLKRLGNGIATIIILGVTLSLWFEKPIDDREVSLLFKLFFSYYLLAMLVMIIFISYRYKIKKHGSFMIEMMRFAGGYGMFLFPFLWPLCFISDFPSKIVKALGLTLSEKSERNKKKDG